MQNPIKMDDLGVPLFLETPKLTNTLGHFLIVVHTIFMICSDHHPLINLTYATYSFV